MKAIAVIILPAFLLGGCSSLSATAEKLGVNFWSNSPMKAPCKVASYGEGAGFCIGNPIEKPSEEELDLLRGRYIVEMLDPPEFYSSDQPEYNAPNVALAP